MDVTIYPIDLTGTYYVKPLPIVTSDWGADAVAVPASGATITDPADAYWMFEQAGDDPASTDDQVAVLSTLIAKLKDAINIDNTAGAGAIAWPITIEDSNSEPIAGVAVWITTDEAGTQAIAGPLITNTFGKATFLLDAGTYYVWRQLSGWNFENPQIIEVS